MLFRSLGDWWLATYLLAVPWSPLFYVMAWPFPGMLVPSAWKWSLLAVWSFPFCWLGMAATVRRLRDAAIDVRLAGLFVVPCINLLLFSLACVLPSATARQRASSLPPRTAHFPWPALIAAATSILLLIACLTAVPSYGLALFLGVPFMQGFVVGTLTSDRLLTDSF